MKTRPIEAISTSRSSRGNEAYTLKKSEPPHVGCHGFETGSIKLSIATNDGQFVARYSEKGLAELDFPAKGRAGLPPGQNARQRVPTAIRRWHRTTAVALKAVLAGRAAKTLPPLDWSGKTEFQKSVWRALSKIRRGQTKSYGEIAQAIGKPKAIRAVGGAGGANPIPVLVPCHRVLAANGKIGGFSGGLDWKRKLLVREGVKI
jgi:O-6-methylguanine DNA methyltransferase